MSKKNGRPKRKKPKGLPRGSTKVKGNFTKWDNSFYVSIYRLANDGLADVKIAKKLGVSQQTFSAWKRDDPAVKDAIARGKEKINHKDLGPTLEEYVYGQLSVELQKLWDEIHAHEGAPGGFELIQEILTKKGSTRARQSLFIHSYLINSFNASAACKSVGIAYRTFVHWAKTDSKFCELMQEMVQHKKNFFEDALVKLIKRGDGPATIFANKTYNKDRGYGEKVNVEVNGTVQHNHTHQIVPIDELDLPLGTRKKLLAAVRDHNAETGPHPVIEVEHKVRSNGS